MTMLQRLKLEMRMTESDQDSAQFNLNRSRSIFEERKSMTKMEKERSRSPKKQAFGGFNEYLARRAIEVSPDVINHN